MMIKYCKKISTGEILFSSNINQPDSQILANALSMTDVVETDIEIGEMSFDALKVESESYIEALETPLDIWKQDMQATDQACPRWFEDYITENSVTLAPGRAKDSYDAKVALRAGRPV